MQVTPRAEGEGGGGWVAGRGRCGGGIIAEKGEQSGREWE